MTPTQFLTACYRMASYYGITLPDTMTEGDAVRDMHYAGADHPGDATAMAAPSPRKPLPEGCPSTLEYFTRAHSLFINSEDVVPGRPEPSVTVEIHPEGTTAYITALEARVAALEGVLGGLVSAADENPFCPIGHLIEHVFPDARAVLSAGRVA